MSTRMRQQLLKRARVRHDCDRVGRILRLLSVSEAGQYEKAGTHREINVRAYAGG